MSPLSLELYHAFLAQPKNLILIQRSATPFYNNNSLRLIFIVKYGQGFGILFRSVKFSMLLKFNKCSITRSL